MPGQSKSKSKKADDSAQSGTRSSSGDSTRRSDAATHGRPLEGPGWIDPDHHPFEREAEYMADAFGDPDGWQDPVWGAFDAPDGGVFRQARSEREPVAVPGDVDQRLDRARSGGDVLGAGPGNSLPPFSDPANREEKQAETLANRVSKRTEGSPTVESLRRTFDETTGLDTTGARFIKGGVADTITRHGGTDAVTVGKHILFQSGALDLESQAGRQTVAHELAHVGLHSDRHVAWRNNPNNDESVPVYDVDAPPAI